MIGATGGQANMIERAIILTMEQDLLGLLVLNKKTRFSELNETIIVDTQAVNGH